MSKKSFLDVADDIAADIASGRWGPGFRLPTHRELAEKRGIAISTASRVFAELSRRALVAGEVGRGTFVRAGRAAAGDALAGVPSAAVNLEVNVPILATQTAAMAPALEALSRAGPLAQALTPVSATGTVEARARSASFLARAGWSPEASNLAFTGNGRQAIAAAFAACAPPGARIGVEALTYPPVRGIAARLGITLVPMELDEQGVVPDALIKAHRGSRLHAVYLQPTLHNPLGIVMPPSRRKALAGVINSTGLKVIEDGVYGFLADERPFAALLPERTLLIDSLSKRLAPGLTVGFVVCPSGLLEAVTAAIRSLGVAASAFALAATMRWMQDGTLARVARAKRTDAQRRQRLARSVLAGLPLMGDSRAYHLWLELPIPWRAEPFVAEAARRGIAVAAGEAFAVGPGHAPNCVRLALASPPLHTLEQALTTLRQIVLAGPSNVSGPD